MAIDRKDITPMVREIYSNIGIDQPVNHEEIVDFIKDDLEETADPVLWHSGDVIIAFRRFLEKDTEV